MIELRPYQNDIIDETRQALASHRSVLIQSPTGSGKTALSAKMLGNASANGKRAFFICHKVELIEQTARTFDDVGIEYGYIANGFRSNPYQPVQLCSIDSLKNRLDDVKPPDFCVWDEAHHVAAKGWADVHGCYDKAYHVGLTATPERLDGKGLGEWFDYMVKGPKVAWLIENGYLSDYRAFAPSIPDLNGVHKRMGDFKKDELEAIMDSKALMGNVLTHYNKLAMGKQAVAFCVSIKHSQHVAEQFRQVGIMAVHIDGKMNKNDRKKAIQGFRNGTIRVLTNVDIVGEGFDLPAIECAILLRPTQSLALFLQQVGRPLRPSEDKAIILDHAGNIMRHGLPDDDREWSLEGNAGKGGKGVKDEDKEPIRQCPVCFYVHSPAPKCPGCNYEYPIADIIPEEIEGELVEISAEERRKQQYAEQSTARDLDSLIELGKERGYKKPEAWAAHVMSSRNAKRGKYAHGR